jgi:hypothetical protein
MITVEFQSASRSRLDVAPFSFDPVGDEGNSDDFRVRHLITKLVHETVRDFHLRETDRGSRAMTPDELAKGLAVGRFGSPREESQTIDVEIAVGQALQAFEDGLYLLFVDEAEKRSLEDRLTLMPDTKVVIIRLTALAGG